MKKDFRSAEILAHEDFNWKDMIIFLMDTKLEKMLIEMFGQGMFPENTKTEELDDLKKYIENKFREKI